MYSDEARAWEQGALVTIEPRTLFMYVIWYDHFSFFMSIKILMAFQTSLLNVVMIGFLIS